ncbi:MAG: hemolysin family protein [Myxococcota bacterium]
MTVLAAIQGASVLTLVLVALMLLAGSFFFSGTETAFFSLQKVDRDILARVDASGQQVVALLARRQALIPTVLLGNETMNVALTATSAALIHQLTEGNAAQSAAGLLNVLVLPPILVLVSEITPKILARRYRRHWAPAVVWPLTAFFVLVTPIRIVVSAFVSLVAGLLGASRELPKGVQPEELLVYVNHGTESGALDPLERDIIEAVFEFDELTVERLMTPRPDVFSVPLALPFDKMLRHIAENPHSRIPVHGTNDDDIVGILLLKDLLRFKTAPPSGPRQLRSLLLQPHIVPASKSADSMLQEFLRRRSHMAIVVDEHGTFVGIVTLDDLLQVLLGEDEHTDESDILRLQPDALTVKAGIDVEDFEEETAIELPDGDYHTLGGFVFHELGRLPRKGDVVEFGDHRFVVAKMEGRRIAEIIVKSPTSDQEAV